MEKDKQFKLSDGRLIGFSETGDPDGKPMLYFHGFGSSRYEAINMDEMAKKNGIRVITPDRPGYGMSDLKKGFQLADYPADIVELVDSLGLEKFIVTGFAMGSAFALPCVIKIPERVTALYLLSGLVPNPGPKKPNMFLMKLMAGTVKKKSKDEAAFKQLFAKFLVSKQFNLAKPDIDVLKNDQFMQSVLDFEYEGCRRSTAGLVNDAYITGARWPFEFKDINPSIPVFIFHGEADTQVLVSAVKKIAATIPNCTEKYFPSEGTISWMLNQQIMDEIYESLQS